MKPVEVKRILGRYRDLIDRHMQSLEKSKDIQPPLSDAVPDEAMSLIVRTMESGTMITICRLEIQTIDEAVVWLNELEKCHTPEKSRGKRKKQ